MLAWICENTATIIITAVLLSVVIAIIIRLVKNKKKGRPSCGCGCSGCPMSSLCHSKK
ncbi:MAG: FeoB-associated Cys-rich membrane protein [Acutalibacteraceae bacterium]